MKLIIGLGNPEKKYQYTRHNLGEFVLEKFISSKNIPLLRLQKKLNSRVGEWSKNILAAPSEYMNNSGISVKKISAYYKIPSQNIYVIHDDLDLPVGEWRLQFDRGPAGHNGIKSVIEHLKTQAFWRLRIGIGHPQNNQSVEDYVLQPFGKEEKKLINKIIPEILDKIDQIITN